MSKQPLTVGKVVFSQQGNDLPWHVWQAKPAGGALRNGDVDAILQTMDELERSLADAQERLARLEQFFPRDRAAAVDTSRDQVRQIQNAVAAHAEMSAQQMLSDSRREDIVWPRQVSMWLTRQLLPGLSLRAIADLFNRTDHSTVVHACKVVENEIATDAGKDARVRALLGHLKHFFAGQLEQKK